MLEWTLTPKTEIVKDGSVKCFITTPDIAASKARQHRLHLLREFEMMPAITMKPKPPQSSPNQALEIRVHEADFRRCQNHVELLSRCELLPMKEETGKHHGKGKTRSSHSLCHAAAKSKRCGSLAALKIGEHQQKAEGKGTPANKPKYEPLRLPKRSSSCPLLAKPNFQRESLFAKESSKVCVDEPKSRSKSASGNVDTRSSLPTLFAMCH